MTKILALFAIAGTAWVFQVPSAQSRIAFQTAINPKSSYANEAKHMVHVVMKVAFALSNVRPAARARLVAELKADVSLRTCLMLQTSGKEFGYVKTPDGLMELEVQDTTGVLLFVQRTAWKTCAQIK